jgi:5-(carboxyamino)imidazole ribonucleotide synthase
VIPPGAVLGVLGSGQLGRMFTIAARQMGYRVHTFSPESDTPTGQVADVEVTASYDDTDALRAFAQQVAVVTLNSRTPAPPPRSGPGPAALPAPRLAAGREKTPYRNRCPPPYAVASTEAELAALASVGVPGRQNGGIG